MERRVRGVDLYGRSPLDSGPEAVGSGSFHSIPFGWVGQGGRTGSRSLGGSQRAQEQVLCGETPERAPLKNRIKAQN